mmetsp:Transcript_6733/g.12466  ORF Transcript_6733/g.12466 Transcript_6733/m.12466 type:complete len:424 (+) Transcript_6733:275-1546(+)
MLNNCKAALKREKEKIMLQHRAKAKQDDGSLSSLFSKISTGVSEIVRGNLNEVVKTAESGALVYQQCISKANRRQEKYINKDLPRYLKHYALLSTCVTKMTRKALQAGFEFQLKDSSFASLSRVLVKQVNQINPTSGVQEMISSCLRFYEDVIANFSCSKWKYELPIHPLQIKNRFRLSKTAKQSPSKRDFVVVKNKQTNRKKQQQQQQPQQQQERRIARKKKKKMSSRTRRTTMDEKQGGQANQRAAAADDDHDHHQSTTLKGSTLIDTRFIETDFPSLKDHQNNKKKDTDKSGAAAADNDHDAAAASDLLVDIIGGGEDDDPFDKKNKNVQEQDQDHDDDDDDDANDMKASPKLGVSSLDSNMPVFEGEQQEEANRAEAALKKNPILTDLLDSGGEDDEDVEGALQKEMAAVIAADGEMSP